MESLEPRLADNPFPGLRSFQPDEADVFFGRQRQIDDLLWRLDQAPLIAVAGSSGCGKSSLVLAGLINALGRERDRGDDVQWRPVVMRPGNDPIANLARPLAVALVGAGPQDPARVAALAGRLRLGGVGLAEAVRIARLPTTTRLLIVVDQFEEIFRYRRMTDAEDCTAFVKLLLHAANANDTPVQVVLTMRSEALGHCADFRDLPEAVSRGQFLVPRLTREQRKEAIIGPVERRGFRIAPRLVQRVLNDVSDDFDDLPVMQHALSQTWVRWAAQAKGERPIDLEDYEAVGGARRAISQHADEAFASLPGLEAVVERVFRALTERLGAAGSEVRRPLPFNQLCAVVAAGEGQVAAVVERYRRADTVFLLPSPEVELATNPVIDISHESLIRGWDRLKVWAEREALSAQMYRRVAESARLFDADEEGLLRDRALQFALDWREQNQPSADWAALYQPGFDGAMSFLDASRQTRDDERAALQRSKLLRTRLTAASFVVVVAVAALMALLWQRGEEANEQLKVEQRTSAQQAEKLRITNERIAKQAESRRLALAASKALVAGSTETALLLSSAALKIEPAAEEAQEILRKALLDAPRRILRGHAETFRVSSLAFHPDSVRLASAAGDGSVIVWDVLTGTAIDRPPRSPGGPPAQVAFTSGGTLLGSPDGEGKAIVRDAAGTIDRPRLEGERADAGLPVPESFGGGETAIHAGRGWFAAVRSGVGIRIWNLRTGKLIASRPDEGEITKLAFSPDGVTLAAVKDRRDIQLWDFASSRQPKRLSRIASSDDMQTIAFSPDGKRLASVAGQGIALWDIGRGRLERRLVLQGARIDIVAFSRDGAHLAGGDSEGTVAVWEVASGARQRHFDKIHRGPVTSLAFSRSGRSIASAGLYGQVIVSRTDSAQDGQPRHLSGALGAAPMLVFSEDGKTLVAAANDGSILLWDVGDSAPRHGAFNEQAYAVAAIAFEPSGRRLALASEDGFVKFWNVARGRSRAPVLSGAELPLRSVAFSRDGSRVAAGSEDGWILIWKAEPSTLPSNPEEDTRVPLGAPLKGHQGKKVSALAYSPDGQRIASGGGDGMILLWDTASERGRALPKVHADGVTSVAFNREGSLLATAASDGSLILWNLADERPVKIETPGATEVYAVAFSPDGNQLAAAIDNEVRVFGVPSGIVEKVMRNGSTVIAIAFDPRGGQLATGDASGVVRLWNVRDGQKIGQEFEGHEGPAWSLAFSPDGKTLASAGADRRIILWDADVTNWVARACRIVNRDVKPGEWPRRLSANQQQVCPP